MCGIAGLYNPRNPVSADQVRLMTDAIAHRGPDDAGLQVLDSGHLVLGHRRLSIIDLSPSGHQPMSSLDGRWWIVFNGEIYNFRQLRAELGPHGFRFHSESDTEVILAAYQHWGIAAFERFRGMFALAIWDASQRKLLLARDRFGVKPLYYCTGAFGVAFGSELRTLIATGYAKREVNPEAMAEYLQFGYISAPNAILDGVRVLAPGRTVAVDAALAEEHATYWDTTAVFVEGQSNELRAELAALPESMLMDRAEDILSEAFALRLVSDVPVGLFLSGGIDSSLVAALLARRSGAALRTFTIGYPNSEFDESAYSRQVAQTLGAQHTERMVEPDEALRLCEQIPEVFDEPMADSSCIPTLMVCKLARQEVKVALSADGADEFFGGYARYRVAGRFLHRRRQLGGRLLTMSADLLGRLPREWIGAAYRASARGGRRYAAIEDKLRKFTAMARAGSDVDAYVASVSEWSSDDVRGMVRRPCVHLDHSATWAAFPAEDHRARMMHFDTVRYLTGDLLTKVDRTSMSVSLEAREPFLDPQIARLAAALPMSWRINGGAGKYLLRRLLSRYFPADFFDRPKQGFSAPIGKWLRGPLRESLLDRLSPASIRRVGLLEPHTVQRQLQGFLAGRGDASAAGIWYVFQLQSWADRWLSSRTGG